MRSGRSGKSLPTSRRADGRLTGQHDSFYPALAERGLQVPSSPAPADRPWDFDNPANPPAPVQNLTTVPEGTVKQGLVAFPVKTPLRQWNNATRDSQIPPISLYRAQASARTVDVEADLNDGYLRTHCGLPHSLSVVRGQVGCVAIDNWLQIVDRLCMALEERAGA
jgi:hypothetical protein